MKTLTYTQPHHLSKLHDELLTIPGLRPVGEGEARTAAMSLSGDGQALTLRVPDGADEVAIRAVVEAHDPTPPPPPPDPQAELAAAIEAVDTSTIVDPAVAAAIEALKAALLGAEPGAVARVAARSIGGQSGT
jgi:hypothetical protein